jgi:uncharacterized membrane protein YdbT with pleckstrin-like domain
VEAWLEDGEEIRVEERPHAAALVRPLARPLALGAGGIVLVALGGSLSWVVQVTGALAIVLAALVGLRAVWRWDRTVLVVTSEQLLVVGGTFRRHAASVSLDRPGHVAVEQGIAGRLLGYGTLVVGELEIPYVRRPRELTRLVRAV